jgi:hypothetical protein
MNARVVFDYAWLKFGCLTSVFSPGSMVLQPGNAWAHPGVL